MSLSQGGFHTKTGPVILIRSWHCKSEIVSDSEDNQRAKEIKESVP